jgi:uncharacterized RmlC-like cupin family protein
MSHSPQPTVSIVTPDQFSDGTSQTAGSQRASAISKDQQIHSSLWGGTFLVEPGAKTGIHHHGEQDTIAYVLAGESLVRWGEHGEHSGIARAGDFLHIPAGLIHQEVNPSATEPFRWIVIRSTPEPIVVNLPDEVWGK